MEGGCVTQQTKEPKSIQLPVIGSSKASDQKIRPSKASRWRAGALIALNVLMAIHIIQWWLMGKTVTPIEPSESMYTLQNGAVNAGFIFFSLALLATLIFGRFVCGWGCHVLALQDLCAWILKKIGVKPRPFRSRLLIWVPLIVALYMFVWPTVYRFLSKPPEQPLFPEFTNHLITTEFWATFPPFWVAVPFLFVCGFMTVYFLGSKGFCTYACPYGGFFAVLDKFSPGRIRVTDDCNQCGHCTATCTSNVLVHAEVKEYGMVTDPGCMKCMDCVSVCPTNALHFGFGKPATGVKQTIERRYSLTWPEEAAAAGVFALSFFAVWDVYQLVPMLMALGIACVTTFLAMRTIRFVRSADLSFYRHVLKSGGSIRKAGWAFLSFAVVWVGLNIHSGWVRYHEQTAASAYQRLTIPDELALAAADPSQWLSAHDRQNADTARTHFASAANAGLFTNREAISKRAWAEYLAGDTERALELLREASKRQIGTSKALSHYYRGALLNRLGRPDEALDDLSEAAKVSPELVTVLEEKGEALWRLGRASEAASAWSEALRKRPGLPVAGFFLAGASSGGDGGAGSSYERLAKAAPADPYFQWMLGLRLRNLGMNELADKCFAKAVQMNPSFRARFAALPPEV